MDMYIACRKLGGLVTPLCKVSMGIRSVLDSVDVISGQGKTPDDISLHNSTTDTTLDSNMGRYNQMCVEQNVSTAIQGKSVFCFIIGDVLILVLHATA